MTSLIQALGKRPAAVLLIQAILVLLGSSFAVGAQAADCSAPAPAKTAENIGDNAFYALQKASQLIEQKKIPEAISRLNEAVEKGSDYDNAMISYNIGIAYSELNDMPNATAAFAKALSFNALPQQQTEQLEFNLGQLYVTTNHYDEGIKVLQTYFSTACGTVTPESHMFLASALAARERYPEALQEVDLVLSKIPQPKESWLQFRLGIEYELKNYKECSDTLIRLITMTPDKPEYWKQLSGVLLQMDNDEQATAVLALAERQSMLQKPDDITNLYNTYMLIGEPVKAAGLINAAMESNKLPSDEKTLQMVSDAWINARESEKAEDTLKKLAGMSDHGEYYFKLGAMYGDQQRWKESKEAIERAIEKGGLKTPGNAYFRIAVANYGLGDLKGAIASLQKASTFDDSRQQAMEWLRTLGTGSDQPAKPSPAKSSAADPAAGAGKKS